MEYETQAYACFRLYWYYISMGFRTIRARMEFNFFLFNLFIPYTNTLILTHHNIQQYHEHQQHCSKREKNFSKKW